MEIENQSGEDVVYEVTSGGPIGDKAREVLGRIDGYGENIFNETILHLTNTLGIAGGIGIGNSVRVMGVERFDSTNDAMLSTYRLSDLGTPIDTVPVSPTGAYVIDTGLIIR